jgi:uncharacterized protein (TIGR03118 family)
MCPWIQVRPTRRPIHPAPGRRKWPHRLDLEALEDRCVPSGYARVNLASDIPNLAAVTNASLVNPWGVSYSPTGPFWFADAGMGASSLSDGQGQTVPLLVSLYPTASPTGTVFNPGSGFQVGRGGITADSQFLFATEGGTIEGWAPAVDLTHTITAVDRSAEGANYKGLALAADPTGRPFLLAADFGHGNIDVFDAQFQPVARPGAFSDPGLPAGYAPFNVQAIGGELFVTYAQQDEAAFDSVAGPGRGFIDVYDTAGNLLRRFASAGALDAPWGLAEAPADFGPYGGALLVANNGDGQILAYNPASGAFLGRLTDDQGAPLAVPGLWALAFGNDHLGGDSHTLFFTAGIDDEQHGLFGAIQSPQRRGTDTGGRGGFDPHAPGERADYPLPPMNGPTVQPVNATQPTPVAVLLPMSQASLVLLPTLSTLAPASLPGVSGEAAVTPSSVGSSAAPGIAAFGITAGPAVADYAQPQTAMRTNWLPLSSFLDLNGTTRRQAPDRELRASDVESIPVSDSPSVAIASEASGGDIVAAPVMLEPAPPGIETTVAPEVVPIQNHAAWMPLSRPLFGVVGLLAIWSWLDRHRDHGKYPRQQTNR